MKKELSGLELKLLFNSYNENPIPPGSDLIKEHWISNQPQSIALNNKLKQNRQEWLNTFAPVTEIMVMEELPTVRETFFV